MLRTLLYSCLLISLGLGPLSSANTFKRQLIQLEEAEAIQSELGLPIDLDAPSSRSLHLDRTQCEPRRGISDSSAKIDVLSPEDRILNKKLQIIPVGICCKGEPTRIIALIHIQGVSYINQKGHPENWIPFYRSTGTFSQNAGAWFPFYGIAVGDHPIPPSRGGSPIWFMKTLNHYRGRFNQKIDSLTFVGLQLTFGVPNSEFLKRVENDPVLYLMSHRLSRRLST
jgi:hypothetical protein